VPARGERGTAAPRVGFRAAARASPKTCAGWEGHVDRGLARPKHHRWSRKAVRPQMTTRGLWPPHRHTLLLALRLSSFESAVAPTQERGQRVPAGAGESSSCLTHRSKLCRSSDNPRDSGRHKHSSAPSAQLLAGAYGAVEQRHGAQRLPKGTPEKCTQELAPQAGPQRWARKPEQGRKPATTAAAPAVVGGI
jgi:hypothetical protein